MTTNAANVTIPLMADTTPGQVFGPNNHQPKQDEQAQPLPQNTAVPIAQSPTVPPNPEPTPTPQPPAPVVAPVVPEQNNTPSEQPLEYEAETPTPYALPASEAEQPPETEAITWTASEYIAHHKSPLWFVVLGIAAVVASLGVYFITDGDIVSTIVVLLVAIIFGAYAARKPRVQQYAVSPAGVTIGSRTYGFDVIKSFSVIDEGPFASITFMPMQRFMPVISIYFDPQDEDRIVTFLAQYLPMEQRNHDAIDRLMRKLKF